jgi:hypothetical protein
MVKYTSTSPLPSIEQPEMTLMPVSKELFLLHEPYTNTFQPVIFSAFEAGRPRYSFASHRVARRID